MWSFPAKIGPKNAKAFKTSTFGITWCDNFWPKVWLEVAEGFHIRWRMLAAHKSDKKCYFLVMLGGLGYFSFTLELTPAATFALLWMFRRRTCNLLDSEMNGRKRHMQFRHEPKCLEVQMVNLFSCPGNAGQHKEFVLHFRRTKLTRSEISQIFWPLLCGVLLEKGSVQKSPFSRDSRECRDSRDISYLNSVLTKWGFLWIHGF